MRGRSTDPVVASWVQLEVGDQQCCCRRPVGVQGSVSLTRASGRSLIFLVSQSFPALLHSPHGMGVSNTHALHGCLARIPLRRWLRSKPSGGAAQTWVKLINLWRPTTSTVVCVLVCLPKTHWLPSPVLALRQLLTMKGGGAAQPSLSSATQQTLL